LAAVLVSAMVLGGCVAGDRATERRYGQQHVCHEGEQTLAVSTADMFVHEQHGDTLGPCPHDG
jgi:hypothetical protein